METTASAREPIRPRGWETLVDLSDTLLSHSDLSPRVEVAPLSLMVFVEKLRRGEVCVIK